MKDTLFITLQHLLPQHLLSRLVGRLAASECRWIKSPFIKLFARKYRVNMQEALEENLDAYTSFNAFFTRALKPGVRPLDGADEAIVSPADGAFSQLGRIDHGRIFQAKGRGYGLTSLLGGDPARAEPFKNGHFATIYLSPSDYHRVHMPLAGTLRETVYVPGDLYSVNQTTAENVDQLFARNERLVAIFDTELGPMAMVLVGAMIVAGIETVWDGQIAPPPRSPQHKQFAGEQAAVQLAKGDEMGRFKLGSTVILLFGPDAIAWKDQLQAGTTIQLGQRIAEGSQPPA
ncbi:archaetidylserine decarboxylase [Marinobacterium arenosum]|uniref:archaetidylserine decarboxylase n=1 Tax=Marinobacterium arenosum TaxID=2862496 RepID=UPI001C93C76C|nr:archaetidylserine decarboxylase [Marinobacterium arenosum]MBY4677046.1 archaetidylserine decarboxylase [Marinobacterium arenosum]